MKTKKEYAVGLFDKGRFVGYHRSDNKLRTFPSLIVAAAEAEALTNLGVKVGWEYVVVDYPRKDKF